MVKTTYRGYRLKTMGRTVSEHRVITDGGGRRTVVIEMLPPLRVLASQEAWPSSEDEMEIYENQGNEFEGTGR